jgi:hypothetical protein
MQFSGVVPDLSIVADLGPPRSECGIGCLMPWCGKLYVLSYVSHRRQTGTGTGLRVIERDLTMTRHPAAVDGTYANRMVHHPSNQLVIGPHIIDARHHVRTVPELVDIRLAGSAWHLTDPDRLVYILGMEGELFELDVRSLACKQIADLTAALGTEGEGRVHFKDCFTRFGRLVVASNEYDEEDFLGKRAQGRLAEFDGRSWHILERRPYYAIQGVGGFGGSCALFATGWDRASALLSVYTPDHGWERYRLPKASHCFDHKWQTEWPRIREVEHERLLVDCHGMFYELSPHAYTGHIWGLRPISTHLWVIPDFCTYRGLLVLGSDNASPHDARDGNFLTAEPQSGLWLGKTDDLWHFGKPRGWGGPWWSDHVKAHQPSDPYLMTGFEHKCLHLSQKGKARVTFSIEVDFQGHGEYHRYATIAVPASGYAHHEFPSGFSAHWVRLVPSAACVATAQFHYT